MHLMKLMTSHPASVGESYAEHMWFATRFSLMLFAAAGAALIHAFLPFLFEKTASRIVDDLYVRTSNRAGASSPTDGNRQSG